LWLLFSGLIAYALISDYKPEEKVTLALNESPTVVNDSAMLTLLSWNTGYSGLDKDMVV